MKTSASTIRKSSRNELARLLRQLEALVRGGAMEVEQLIAKDIEDKSHPICEALTRRPDFYFPFGAQNRIPRLVGKAGRERVLWRWSRPLRYERTYGQAVVEKLLNGPPMVAGFEIPSEAHPSR